jgi:hypothetical protein
MKPKKATESAYLFDFDVNPKEFPEIALYKECSFNWGENKNFSSTLL